MILRCVRLCGVIGSYEVSAYQISPATAKNLEKTRPCRVLDKYREMT